MPSLSTLISGQASLLLIIVLGIILEHLGVMGEQARPNFNKILNFVLIPASVFYGLQTGDGSLEMWKSFGSTIGISSVFYVLIFILAKVLYGKKDESRRAILQHGLLVNNILYIGMPVLVGFYGPEAILYMSALIIPHNIAMWGFGLSFFSDKSEKKSLLEILRQPVMVSLILGLIFLVIPFELPGFMDKALANIAAAATPLALIVVGSALYHVDKKQVASLDTWIYCGIRLLAIPLVIWLVLRNFDLKPVMLGTIILSFAMPAAINTAVITGQYKKDQAYASALIFLSTFLSMITIPFLAWLIA